MVQYVTSVSTKSGYYVDYAERIVSSLHGVRVYVQACMHVCVCVCMSVCMCNREVSGSHLTLSQTLVHLSIG